MIFFFCKYVWKIYIVVKSRTYINYKPKFAGWDSNKEPNQFGQGQRTPSAFNYHNKLINISNSFHPFLHYNLNFNSKNNYSPSFTTCSCQILPWFLVRIIGIIGDIFIYFLTNMNNIFLSLVWPVFLNLDWALIWSESDLRVIQFDWCHQHNMTKKIICVTINVMTVGSIWFNS